MVAAVLLWIISGAVDRRTEVEISSTGGRIDVDISGTTLSAPIAVNDLTAVEILAMDSIDPPGGRLFTLSNDEGPVIRERLPRRFRFPAADFVPIGDWEIDEKSAFRAVWHRGVEVRGPFTLHASLRGRFHHDLSIVLLADPPVEIAVRRGLINNDCSIRDDEGITRATSSIDPTPLSDIGATSATVLRATAVAALLIAVFAMFLIRSRPATVPSASRHFRGVPLVLILAAAAVALSGWAARSIFEGLPHTPDSVTYLLQAGWMLGGSLWGEVSPIQEYLTVPFTYVDGSRWLGHYPPAWPALLAVGLAAGAPWLVAPLLGGVFVLLLYLVGREMAGPAVGLMAAALAVISPVARVIFGSMMSHGAAATLIVAALWSVLVARRMKSWPAAVGAGIALGLAFGIRPLSAVAIALPIGALLVLDLEPTVLRRSAQRRLLGFTVGGCVGAAPALVANSIITGSALAFPYSLYGKGMYLTENIPFGLRNLDVLLASTGASLYGWGWEMVHGPIVGAVALAFSLVPFLMRRRRSYDLLLGAMVVCVLVLHLGTRGHGLHGFGPRYYFEVFACLFLLTARGFQELGRMGGTGQLVERRIPAAAAGLLFFALCMPAGAILPRRLELYRGYNGVDGTLEKQVVSAELEKALILLPPDNWRGWAMAARLMDPDPDADLVFVQAEPDDPGIQSIAGDRAIYLWRDSRLGSLEQHVPRSNIAR
jgi:hypothetical protein